MVRLRADRAPDVVEQSGGLEQGPRRWRHPVQGRRAVEQLEREPGDLSGMPGIDAESAGDGHRGVRQRFVRRSAAAAAEEIDQDPVAQAAVHAVDAGEPQVLHGALEDDRAGHDDLCPARVEPLAPLVHGHCRELLGRLAHLIPRGRLSLARGVAHDRVDGSRASQRAAEDGGIPGQRIERLAHERPHEGELALRNAARSREDVGEPHRSHGNAPEVLRVLAEGGDDFGGATADVDDRPARLRRRTVQNAQADQAGLLAARDDLQRQSRALADPPGDLRAVGCLA